MLKFYFSFKLQIKHAADVKNNDFFQEMPTVYTGIVHSSS